MMKVTYNGSEIELSNVKDDNPSKKINQTEDDYKKFKNKFK